MKNRNSIGIALTFITCSYALLYAGDGWAQGVVADNLEKRGRMALDAKQYSAAREMFAEGSARATDPKVKARLDFRQAVTLQQMANTGEAENPEENLRQAAAIYHTYLKQNPNSAATANNLAKIYETLGNASLQRNESRQAKGYFRRATGYYRKAVAAGDSNQGLYLKNYAEFLERTDNWEEAKKVYAQLVQGYPVSPALLKALTRSYLRHGPGDLAELLWNMLDAGYVSQSAKIAMGALRRTLNDTNDSRIELLTIVSAALAQGTDDRNRFPGSDMGRQTSALSADNFLGDGAGEIARLYQGQSFSVSDYAWWAERDFGTQDLGKGLYPIDGFRALIRSLGSRSKRSGDLELAESYFLLAARMQESEADPVAIRDLVQMYAEANEFEKIKGVLADYQFRLFQGKGDAYRDSHIEKIFQYHQTLGELYTLIERWGDSNKIDSAIFQLEHAQQTSVELVRAREESFRQGRVSSKTLPESYQFTPQMVDQLSRGYEKTGEPDKGVELRINQASIYHEAGDTKAALRVLAPIKSTELPSGYYKTQYEKLIISPELKSPVGRSNLHRPSIEGLEKSRQ
jgi:tetratricopeptide (TPR) repeat protein